MANYSISASQIEKYLKSDEFDQFSIKMSKVLDVNDLYFGVEYRGIEKQFPMKNSLAFTNFGNDYCEFRGIYFLTSRIASEAESIYPNCMDKKVKEEIVKVLTDFLLIHELTHLSQFKRGYTEELRKSATSSVEQYKTCWIEREANLQAYKYLRGRNPFTKKVLDCILRRFNGRNRKGTK